MTDHKFVAVLNKKIETNKLMNALGHMTAGLAASFEPKEDLGMIDYQDKDGGAHIASKHPFIVLKAKNSNQIRLLRDLCVKQNIAFASFTSAMTVGTWQEQVAASQATPEAELEYYGICLFGPRSILDELTRKYSLWN